MECWNIQRQIGLLFYDDEISEAENSFKVFLGYVFFILFFIIGISDKSFIYHVDFPPLNPPYMLAILVSDLVILVIFFMLDIKLGSDYNELFKTF